MNDAKTEVVLRVTATFDGEERRVVWQNQRLSGDQEWIARAERIDPNIAQRPPGRLVHALEQAAGTEISLLIADRASSNSLSDDGR